MTVRNITTGNSISYIIYWEDRDVKDRNQKMKPKMGIWELYIHSVKQRGNSFSPVIHTCPLPRQAPAGVRERARAQVQAQAQGRVQVRVRAPVPVRIQV